MVMLRSGINTNEMVNTVNPPNNIDTSGMSPLEIKIEHISRSLQEVQNTLTKSITDHEGEINKLKTRINILESQVKLGEHFAELHDRKLDDMEQFSRKVNLRLKGIEVLRNDSPTAIMEVIKQELSINEVNIPDSEIDRCHRDGKQYVRNGKTYQDVLIKFGLWRSRDIMYKSRKTFSFGVQADLTTRRNDILWAARYDVENEPRVSDVVDFVFADLNCKLKLKTKSNRFYGFNSHDEFLNLVDRLGDELLDDVDARRRKQDEKIDDLFY